MEYDIICSTLLPYIEQKAVVMYDSGGLKLVCWSEFG